MKRVRRFYKQPVAIVLALALLLGGSAFAAGQLLDHNEEPDVATIETATGDISYDPPTPTEVQETEEHKDGLANQESDSTPADGTQKSVTPTIVTATYSTDSQRATVGGLVPSIFEDGGDCTVTLTKGSATITKETKGFANVSRTECPPVFIERSDFPAGGAWSVVLEYSSSAAKGTSAIKELVIP